MLRTLGKFVYLFSSFYHFSRFGAKFFYVACSLFCISHSSPSFVNKTQKHFSCFCCVIMCVCVCECWWVLLTQPCVCVCLVFAERVCFELVFCFPSYSTYSLYSLTIFYPSERERENRHKRECSGIRNNIQIEKMNDEMKWLEMYAYDKRTK